MSDARLKGQEVEIRLTQAGSAVSSIDAIGNFNDSVMLETKQDGFIGETTDRFDDVLHGFSFDLEFRLFSFEDLQTDLLQPEYDIGDVLENPRDTRELVGHIVKLHGIERRPFQRG